MASNERIHVIDNKKVLMTDDEWALYEKICSSYDEPPHQRGKDFFQNLFEVNEQGMITFLRPPTKMCSFEVFLFVMSVMAHQHLRDCYKQVNALNTKSEQRVAALTKQVEDKLAELAAKEKTNEQQ